MNGRPKLRRMRIAYGSWKTTAEWNARPTYEWVKALPLNRLFMAWPNTSVVDGTSGWTLTHRPTGLRVVRVRTLTEARRCLSALLRNTPLRHWNFRAPELDAVNKPPFKGCKDIAKRFAMKEQDASV